MKLNLPRILRRIIRARQQNRLTSVIESWHQYTLTADGLRQGWHCFNCNKRSDGIDYVIPVGNETEKLYFCSSKCESEFKTLLRSC